MLLKFSTPSYLSFIPQLLMTDPKEEQLVYHFIIFIIWYFSRMLSFPIVFLHDTSSSAFLPSGILLGIPWVPLSSCLAPAKWDSAQGQRRALIWQQWTRLERRGVVRCAVLGLSGIDIFSFFYGSGVPPYHLFLSFEKFRCKLPLLYPCFVVLCTTWWHLPLFIPMPWAVTKTQLKMAICTPILLFYSSFLPFLLIPIRPSAQSLGIILQVFSAGK